MVADRRSLLRGNLAAAIDDVSRLTGSWTPESPEIQAPVVTPQLSRPWSMLAAMEALPSSGPARPVTQPAHREPSSQPARAPSRLLARARLVTAGAAAVIAAVGLVIVLLARITQSVGAPQGPGPVSLTAIRPVATAMSLTGVSPPTQLWFPAGTPTVYLDLRSGPAPVTGPVDVTVTRDQASPAIMDARFVLRSGTDTVVPLHSPSGGFAPGNYAVAITYSGHRLGTATFTVG